MNDKNMEKTVRNALESVAKREGISVEDVCREIETAVAAARQNGNPDAKALWQSIPAKNSDSLTAEDVIAYFTRMDMEREN